MLYLISMFIHYDRPGTKNGSAWDQKRVGRTKNGSAWDQKRFMFVVVL
jgi:hypothetical protein